MFKSSSNSSYWETNRILFEGDILIIGAGLVGQSIAIALQKKRLELNKSPLKICIVDKLPAGKTGASTRNAGFACFGSPTEVLDDLTKEEESEVVLRMRNRVDGLSLWKNWISQEVIDWTNHDGFEVFENKEIDIYNNVLKELPRLNKIGRQATGNADIYSVDHNPKYSKLPFSVRINGEAGLHPGKAHAALTELNRNNGTFVFNGIKIESRDTWSYSRDRWTIPSKQGMFKTQKVVVATNAWTPSILPGIDIQPGRGQVLLVTTNNKLPYRGTYHARQGYMYFRNIGNKLLLGGGRDVFLKEENSLDMTITSQVQGYLEDYVRDVLLPNQKFNVENRWAGIMAFGKFEKKSPLLNWHETNILIAARMGGMGVALAPKIGLNAAEMILK
ncbi:MAG: Uncharacterised protein [Owenweeksia sp. TMED14]|nr:MAG: Uncharacterised protein [Owenweeksia sp. TMED14]